MTAPFRHPPRQLPGAKITPLATTYEGVEFRSRAEARWALFFDRIICSWEYEPEGFDLPSGWYLPDFWLEDLQGHGRWVEVKPRYEVSSDALSKCAELVQVTQQDVYLLAGSPSPSTFTHTALRFDPKTGVEFDAEPVAWAMCPECGASGLTTAGDPTLLPVAPGRCEHYKEPTHAALPRAFEHAAAEKFGIR